MEANVIVLKLGCTPLFIALQENVNPKIIEILLKRNANPNIARTSVSR